MANTNCLEGKRCPKCGFEEGIVVQVSMWVSLHDDGTDDCGSDTQYDEDSNARCPECQYRGKFGEWEEMPVENVVEDAEPVTCPGCGFCAKLLGTLGTVTHYRCIACGTDFQA